VLLQHPPPSRLVVSTSRFWLQSTYIVGMGCTATAHRQLLAQTRQATITTNPVVWPSALKEQWVWLRVSFLAPLGLLFKLFWQAAPLFAIVAAVLVHQSLIFRVLIQTIQAELTALPPPAGTGHDQSTLARLYTQLTRMKERSTQKSAETYCETK
jgi:hypothetical protein